MNYGLDAYNTTSYNTAGAEAFGSILAGFGIAMIFVWIINISFNRII